MKRRRYALLALVLVLALLVPSRAAEAPAREPEAAEEIARENLWWMLLVAGGIFLAADAGVILWLRHGGLEKLEERWKSRDDGEELPEDRKAEEDRAVPESDDRQ